MASVHTTAVHLVTDEQDDELPEVQLNLSSAQVDEEEEEQQSHGTATPSSSTPPSSTPADGETGAATRSSVPVTRKDSSDKKSVRFAGKQCSGALPMDASMLKRVAVLEPEEKQRVLAGTSELVNAAQLQRMLQLLQKLNLSKDEIDMLSLDELQARARRPPAATASTRMPTLRVASSQERIGEEGIRSQVRRVSAELEHKEVAYCAQRQLEAPRQLSASSSSRLRGRLPASPTAEIAPLCSPSGGAGGDVEDDGPDDSFALEAGGSTQSILRAEMERLFAQGSDAEPRAP